MKRFTETDKWKDPWYRKLSLKGKSLWQFICDQCDAAGVIDLDMEMVSFYIGATYKDSDLDELQGRIRRLQNGKLHILKFVQFQYGKLSRACKPHAPVFAALEKHGMSSEMVDQNHNYKFTVDECVRQRIIHRDGLVCAYTNAEIPESEVVIDHIIPRAKGGTADDDNLVVSCVAANTAKWDKHVLEFCASAGLDENKVLKTLSERTGKAIEAFRESHKAYLGRLKEKETDKEKDNGRGIGETKEPPKRKDRGTREEIIEFCVGELLPRSDADAIFHKWEGNGWTNGGKPIKDWKATIRSWKVQKFLPSQKNGSAVHSAPNIQPTSVEKAVEDFYK